MKHLKDDCTPGMMTFGNKCMNCGMGYEPTAATERREGLPEHTPTRLSQFIDLYDNGDSYSDKFLVDRLGISYVKAKNIIRAANSHEELLDALKFVVEMDAKDGADRNMPVAIRVAKQAIAKAEGK